MEISLTEENYLKAIWFLQGRDDDGELVPIGQVAERLEVTPGTATTMMNHLARKGLVDYVSRRGVQYNGTKKAHIIIIASGNPR